MPGKTIGRRSKPRKGVNRYNPNRPDYRAVHHPGEFVSGLLSPMAAFARVMLGPRPK
jgi:hypothetical protein